MSKAYHKVLGVPADASADAIKQRWRKLRTKLHPDHGGDAHKFDEARNAFEVLLAEAEEREATCKACKGTGKVTRGSGFASVSMACQTCGGDGRV